MTAVPNEGYFDWLVEQTEHAPNLSPDRSYWELLHQLHLKPYFWFVHNDRNRGEDGKSLREEYRDLVNISDEDFWPDTDPFMLEVLVALSRRVAFDSYGSAADWFWKLIENLELQNYTDAYYNTFVQGEIEEVLDALLQRTYSYEGRGGLFPLREPQQDQRTTEIWYQMSAYVLEGMFVANGP